MPRILVTNDDGVHSEGIKALADALAPLGDVTSRRPDSGSQRHRPRAHAPSSAAHRHDRPERVRGRRHADRLREPGDHARAQGQARSDRLGHQQGLESRRRRDLFGDRVGRARRARCSRFRASPSPTQRVRDECEFGPSAEAAAIVAQAVLERGLPKFTLLNINMPKGPQQGLPRHRAGQAQSRHRR